MRNHRIFWGIFLLTLGVLFLFRQIFNLDYSFGDILSLWPVIFIIWGISLLKINDIIKKIIVGFSGFFVAILIYGLVFSAHKTVNSFCFFPWGDDDVQISLNANKEIIEYNRLTDTVDFNINMGACRLKIEDTVSSLIELRGMGELKYSMDSMKKKAALELNADNFEDFWKNKKRVTSFSLNGNTIWNLKFGVGASDFKADFSDYKVKSLEVNAGASEIKLKLGDKLDKSYVIINAGASSVKLRIPSNSGCEIISELGLANSKFDGFVKENDRYLTPNYNTATKKIFVSIKGGVGDFRVVRY